MHRPRPRATYVDRCTGPSSRAPNLSKEQAPPMQRSNQDTPTHKGLIGARPCCNSGRATPVGLNRRTPQRPPTPLRPPLGPTTQGTATVATAWEAYRAALRAGLRDPLTDTRAFATRAFTKGTRDTYLCAIRNTLMGSDGDTNIQLAINSHLLLLGHQRRRGSVHCR